MEPMEYTRQDLKKLLKPALLDVALRMRLQLRNQKLDDRRSEEMRKEVDNAYVWYRLVMEENANLRRFVEDVLVVKGFAPSSVTRVADGSVTGLMQLADEHWRFNEKNDEPDASTSDGD